MRSQSPALIRITLVGLIIAVSGQACTFSLVQLPELFPALPTQAPSNPSPVAGPMAQTTFVATLPEPLQPGETLTLSIVDEVTGLALNAVYYPMSARDPLTFTAVLPLTLNAVVKYRYLRRSTTQVMEDTNSGRAIRYRMYLVKGPGEIQDVIADWADKAFAKGTGDIQGRVFNADTGTPLPNLLVSAGGIQSISDSTGRFELSGLPVGTHNLVVYAMDGFYETFQQGATVGVGQSTNVDLRVKPMQLVPVTFIVSTPSNTVPGAPIRLAGNLLQLGNTFADLQGGMSTSPDRMPIMTLTADGRYSTTLNLPNGVYVQYKYTLGDGFWNAEHKTSGEFVLRELIVPDQNVLNIVLEDRIQTWQAGPSAPILFEASVPSVTPPGDIIYIQFNPYGWTEPIPMWPLGNNRWAYKLFGPLNMLGSFGYRYCRNGQCGSADDVATGGNTPIAREVATSLTSQDIQDSVSNWIWFENPEPSTLVGSVIEARSAGFVTGVEFQSMYRPNWSYYAPQALANVQALGANQIVLTPSWSYTNLNALTMAPQPGQDPMWIDSAIMISQAQALGLDTAIYPTPHFPASNQNFASSTGKEFWMDSPRDTAWWQAWFDQYRLFAINYADLASQSGAKTLILGGEGVAPALPGGILPDGSPSGAPSDVETRWKALLNEVRQHFSGRLLWALPYVESSLETPLTFLQDTDGIYLLWNAALSENPNAAKEEYVEEAGRLLDNEVSPLPSLIGKPVYLAIAYPSAMGAATNCLPDGEGGCLEWSALSRPNPDVGSVGLNLQGQADIYEAMLTAINARPWIAGVISRGYYPPAALQDKSASVHGKPAADILWYWYPRLTGVVK